MARPIEELLVQRYDIISNLDNDKQLKLQKLLFQNNEWKMNAHRCNDIDKLSLIDCALEITLLDVSNEKNAFDMCIKIQRFLSNQEVRDGWRVSFGTKGSSHRFYYLNDKLKQRRSISFRKLPA